MTKSSEADAHDDAPTERRVTVGSRIAECRTVISTTATVGLQERSWARPAMTSPMATTLTTKGQAFIMLNSLLNTAGEAATLT